jgi:hypothetical protein
LQCQPGDIMEYIPESSDAKSEWVMIDRGVFCGLFFFIGTSSKIPGVPYFIYFLNKIILYGFYLFLKWFEN